MVRIAMDLEGVLADTHGAVLERSDILEPAHFEQWGFDDDEVFNHFMTLSEDVWSKDYEHIPTVEPDTKEFYDKLCEEHEVEILTSRWGVDDSVKKWLRDNGFKYSVITFTKPGTDKSNYETKENGDGGYDVFVDDNPRLAGDVDNLYLYDHPWNQKVVENKQTIRVGSLKDIVEDIAPSYIGGMP